MLILWAALAACASVWDEALRLQPDPTPKVADREYFVVHHPDPHEMCAEHAWDVEAPFPIADHWVLSHPRGHAKRAADAFAFGARQVYESGESRIGKRAPVPARKDIEAVQNEFQITDPLFKDQWHIFNPKEQGHDMNVLPVWRRNITGRGVTVAIVDDGLDFKHPDFSESFSLEGSYDYNRHTQLPEPLLSDDNHGTRCAGEIAAGVNAVCGVGIAPGAKVAGIRILSGKITQDDEARSLIHRSDVNDIYSCSWGPTDDGKTIDGPPAIVRRAELAGIETGRNGRGSIYVVASGNGDFSGDNCNYDGYTNSIYSITVAAVGRQNEHPYYSESCSANLVTTYSSNYYDKITTSDRLNPLKPDQPQCTNQHTGTSAAAPIAAAVFALVLEQRPELTWRDLQYLVRETAQKFDIRSVNGSPEEVVWMTTADGRPYHNSYGYGLLDADKIVERAASWELVKPQTWYFLPAITGDVPIKQNSKSSIEVSRTQWDEANMDHLEHVRVRVSWQHERRGALTFRLVSPAGVVSELAAPRPKDNSFAPVSNWEFMSVVHWNETGNGKWSLEVTGPDDLQGSITSWQLKFFGQAKDASKVRRFSEVWDDYERPEPVVQDPFETMSTPTPTETKPAETPDESKPTGSADKSKPTGSADKSKPTGSADESKPTGSTDESKPTESKEPMSSATPEHNAATQSATQSATSAPVAPGWSKHTLKYYVIATMIGVAVFGSVGAFVILFVIKRRLQTAYEPVEGMELNDYADEFEIDGDESTDPEDDENGTAGGPNR